MKSHRVKVTIEGYYTIKEDELDAYGVDEYDIDTMVQVDRDALTKSAMGAEEIIAWFEEDPKITFNVA